MSLSPSELTSALKEEAIRLGFQAVGIAPPGALQARGQDLARWISAGFAGRLEYMEAFFERQARLLGRFPDLKSIIVVALSYGGESPPAPSKPGAGRIARYAWGGDYHRVIEKVLKRLESFIKTQVKDPPRFVRSIDTGPIQEKVLAEAAGLGFFGKNTCLIRPKGGSFFFLATLLTNLELIPDEPIRWDCGSCTLCLQACPTQALVRPYELDARRCISYLTIELKETIEPALRPLVQDWLFGCDICQEVCPYNRKALQQSRNELQPLAGAGAQLPLEELLNCRTEEAFLDRFAGTPLTRPKRAGLLRNAAIVAGNTGDPQLVPSLKEALCNDTSSLVRQHAAWALGQIGTGEALQALQKALESEAELSVRDEIQAALAACLNPT